jgi:hypothetical protein
MALVDLVTRRTRAFRACAINRGPRQSVTLIDQHANCWCPTHRSGQCVETFHSVSDLASMSWWDLLRMRRRWRVENRIKEQA